MHEKYASEFEETQQHSQSECSGDKSAAASAPVHDSAIEISGKIVEEVGFDKVRRRLAELQELRNVLLDGLCVTGVLAQEEGEEKRDQARREIGRTCPMIKELDLSRNLLSRWCDVADICGQLKQLRLLKLE